MPYILFCGATFFLLYVLVALDNPHSENTRFNKYVNGLVLLLGCYMVVFTYFTIRG